MDIDNYP